MPKQVTIGRTVLYRLTAKDAEEVNRRRTTCALIGERIREGRWPGGAQAHIGNPEGEGSVRPMVVVQVWPDEFGPGVPGVNGKVLLDGTDVLWVTSVGEGAGPGQWHWPVNVSGVREGDLVLYRLRAEDLKDAGVSLAGANAPLRVTGVQPGVGGVSVESVSGRVLACAGCSLTQHKHPLIVEVHGVTEGGRVGQWHWLPEPSDWAVEGGV